MSRFTALGALALVLAFPFACKQLARPDGDFVAGDGGAASVTQAQTGSVRPSTSVSSTESAAESGVNTVDQATGGGCVPGCRTTFDGDDFDCLDDYRIGSEGLAEAEVSEGRLRLTPDPNTGLWQGNKDARVLVTEVGADRPFAALTQVKPFRVVDPTVGSDENLNLAGIVAKRANTPIPESEGWMKNEAGRITDVYGVRAAFQPDHNGLPDHDDDDLDMIQGDELATQGVRLGICRYTDGSLHALHRTSSTAWVESNVGVAIESGALEVGVTAVAFFAADSAGDFESFGLTECSFIMDVATCIAQLEQLEANVPP